MTDTLPSYIVESATIPKNRTTRIRSGQIPLDTVLAFFRKMALTEAYNEHTKQMEKNVVGPEMQNLETCLLEMQPGQMKPVYDPKVRLWYVHRVT